MIKHEILKIVEWLNSPVAVTVWHEVVFYVMLITLIYIYVGKTSHD
jgi:hypothetical protein